MLHPFKIRALRAIRLISDSDNHGEGAKTWLQLLPVSVTYTLPGESTAIPVGL